jgi:hypothetical protein
MPENDPDRPISFNDAARYLPENHRPSYATWWRWSRRGVKGIRLRTLVIGGRRYTTPSAVQEFIAEVTAAANGTPLIVGGHDDDWRRLPNGYACSTAPSSCCG